MDQHDGVDLIAWSVGPNAEWTSCCAYLLLEAMTPSAWHADAESQPLKARSRILGTHGVEVRGPLLAGDLVARIEQADNATQDGLIAEEALADARFDDCSAEPEPIGFRK